MLHVNSSAPKPFLPFLNWGKKKNYRRRNRPFFSVVDSFQSNSFACPSINTKLALFPKLTNVLLFLFCCLFSFFSLAFTLKLTWIWFHFGLYLMKLCFVWPFGSVLICPWYSCFFCCFFCFFINSKMVNCSAFGNRGLAQIYYIIIASFWLGQYFQFSVPQKLNMRNLWLLDVSRVRNAKRSDDGFIGRLLKPFCQCRGSPV